MLHADCRPVNAGRDGDVSDKYAHVRHLHASTLHTVLRKETASLSHSLTWCYSLLGRPVVSIRNYRRQITHAPESLEQLEAVASSCGETALLEVPATPQNILRQGQRPDL